MNTRTAEMVGDLRALIPDFERSLRAGNKAAKTVAIYGDAARRFAGFLIESGMSTQAAQISRENVESWIETQLSTHRPATANQRFRSLQQLFKWMVEEGEITASPMERMKPPNVPEVPVPVLSEGDLKRLLTAADGKDFEARRDSAILRLLIDSGMRLGEITDLQVRDLDRQIRVARVVSKGSRPRACPFGNKTAAAIDRYLRLRSRHRLADSE